MKNNDSAAMYRGNITIAEENRVRGFDPLRFLGTTRCNWKATTN